MSNTVSYQILKVDYLSSFPSAALCCAVIDISTLLSGFLLLLRPHPSWSGCELHVSLCVSLSTSLSLFSHWPCLWPDLET